jgi:hypothetical protein
MDLNPYVENLQRQLAVAAEAGGEDVRALAERLIAPLDAAVRLTLLDALAVAAEEITCDLAPGSIDLRLRGRNPEFVVTLPPVDPAAEGEGYGDHDRTPSGARAAGLAARVSVDGDDGGGMSRINLRMPDHLKGRIERAAAADGLSVNAWLVRAAAAALEADMNLGHPQRTPRGAQRHTGWAR